MSKIRKYVNLLVVLMFSCLFILSSCEAVPENSVVPEASLKLKVSIASDGAVKPEDISYFILDIGNRTFNTVKTVRIEGSSVDTTLSVPVGDTYITATAYGQNGKALGSATGNLSVIADVINAFSLVIDNNVGSGKLDIVIDAYPDLEPGVSIYDPGTGDLVSNILLVREGNRLSANVSLICGEYDLVVRSGERGNILAREKITISAGIDTNFKLDLTDMDAISISITNTISKTPTIAISGYPYYRWDVEYELRAAITGFKTPVIRWYFDTALIEGADTATLKIRMPKKEDVDNEVPHTIKCVVSEGDVIWSARHEFRFHNVDISSLNGVTLQMWHAQSHANGEAMDKVVELFNNTNPYGIKVVATYQGGYGDTNKKILAGLAANQYPNVGQAYNNNMMHYLPSGRLMDLKYYLNDGIGISEADYANVYPSYIGENDSFPDGGVYAVSLGKSTEVLFYNKTFFEDHGINVPTTLEELTEAAAAASAITGKPSFGFDSPDNWGIYGPMNMGAKLFDPSGNVQLYDAENIDKTKAFYSWWENGVDNGWFRLAGEDKYLSGPFSEGSVIMFVGSISGYNYVNPNGFEASVARIPVGPEPHIVQQGGNFCGFNTGDPVVDLATSIFLEFLYTPEASAVYAANTGYLPSNRKAYEEKVLIDCMAADDLKALTKKVCRTYSEEWMTYEPVILEHYEVRKALAVPMQEITNTDNTIDQLIENARKKLSEILGR